MRFGIWWLETTHAFYGHSESIGGRWCVDADGHPWSGSREDAGFKAARMHSAHPSNRYEVRELP